MLKTILVRTIDLCTRHPWTVIAMAAVLSAAAALYTVQNFAINTDVSKLLSPELPWRQRERAFETAFPQRNDIILVVVEAATPERAKDASNRLADALSKRSDAVVSVRQPGGGPFFEKSGLLYLPVDEVERLTRQLATAKPLISALAANRNLKGVMDAIQFGLMGIQAGQLKLDDAVR
ncbi:MAG TPA: hopanoid biosynthesis-associated RND transporter HpnN, partial [Aestuariivirgaceae bacterium]|nr:hopanoid biosynthesis-associated RND transporter HpnN [Aestuariivirgaceae bacterium]